LGKVAELPLYVIDSVLTSRELTLRIEGSQATTVAEKLEIELLGNISAEQLLRANSKLVISGTQRTPFAFTCLRAELKSDGFISLLKMGGLDIVLGASPIGPLPSMPHAELGGRNEFIAFEN
jgi:hypothetical protein